MRISVIIPTRNRVENWRSGPLPRSLKAQVTPPDEIVIALDHCDDDSLTAIRSADLGPAPIRVLDVTVDRPQPLPASGYPDNCLFHAARSDIIVHLDDDLELSPSFLNAVAVAFGTGLTCTIWPQTDFVHLPRGLEDAATDFRVGAAGLIPYPGGFYEIPRNRHLHWGAAYVAPRSLIHFSGGHRLEDCGYHNTDTRLGCRLARLARSYFATAPAWRVLHHGPTWHLLHRDDPKVVRQSATRSPGPPIANLGHRFWSSSWFDRAYKEL